MGDTGQSSGRSTLVRNDRHHTIAATAVPPASVALAAVAKVGESPLKRSVHRATTKQQNVSGNAQIKVTMK